METEPQYGGKFPQAWETIGRLIGFWAAFESEMFAALRNRLGTMMNGSDTEEALILVNGLRYGDMVTAFKRVAAAKQTSQASQDCLADIVDRAALVKGIRDLVAHKNFLILGAGELTFEFELWNRRSKAAPIVAYYSRSELEVCASYARNLAMRVTHELVPLLWGLPPKASEAQLAAWRERPSLPKPPDQDRSRTRTGLSPRWLS